MTRDKKEKTFLIVVVLIVVIVVIATSIKSCVDGTVNSLLTVQDFEEAATTESGKAGEKTMEYTFAKINDEEKIWGTSKICDIYEIFEYDKQPFAYGQMLTLFGEPLYTTENLENQYSYVIEATDSAGNVLYLSVYSGPSGPSIGGSAGADDAAKALVQYIRAAAPSDYDYEGYYMDAPCKVKMGVKNGESYMEEEMLDLTDEEFVELYNKLYGLE